MFDIIFDISDMNQYFWSQCVQRRLISCSWHISKLSCKVKFDFRSVFAIVTDHIVIFDSTNFSTVSTRQTKKQIEDTFWCWVLTIFRANR
jgi:hypothetical protein